MKKILMLSTGGTIASTGSGHGLTPTESGQALIKAVPELEQICQIDSKELMSIDSSNMQPEDWVTIADAVDQEINNYDGIVITHGTDTMAYTSSALSFMLQNLPIPVVLTGSQIPMGMENTDAPGNLVLAFTAASSELKGVYVAFDGIIIKGIHAQKVRSHTAHAFESINAPVVATYQNGVLHINDVSLTKSESTYTKRTNMDTRVLFVKVTPGMPKQALEVIGSMGYRAIICEGYGLGGLPDGKRNISAAVEDLCKRGILVLLGTQCTYEGVDMSVYEVGVNAMEAGALSVGNMTDECAYTKIMWCLANAETQDDAVDLFKTDLCGEWKDYTN